MMTGRCSGDFTMETADPKIRVGRIRPPFRHDRAIRITAKRMSRTPISPGKIPGLSTKPPRLGIVKEAQQMYRPKTRVTHPTLTSRSKAAMILLS